MLRLYCRSFFPTGRVRT